MLVDGSNSIPRRPEHHLIGVLALRSIPGAVITACLVALLIVGCGSDETDEEIILVQASLEIPQTFIADLDRGLIPPPSDRLTGDIWFRAETATSRFLSPFRGATLALVTGPAPRKAGCQRASLKNEAIDVNSLTVGQYVCVETNESRLSQVLITGTPGPSPGVLRVDVTTYER